MPKTARRWLVVAGCFMSILIGPVLVASTFGIFFVALLQSEPWSRAGIAFAYSLYVVFYGLSGPLVGRLCESFGPQKVVLIGAALIAGGFALLGLAREMWQFCLLYGALGITAGMTGIVPVTVLIFRWFVGSRGLAFGLASSGTAGALFLSPLAYSLIEQLGWRRAYPVFGISGGLLLFATILATVRDGPEGAVRIETAAGPPREMESTDRREGTCDLTLREAIGTPPFWLLTGSGFLFLGVLAGVLAHVAPIALDHGLAKKFAALSLGLIIGIGPAGKVALGYLADRYPARKVLAVSFLLQGLAILLVLHGSEPALFWGFVILFSVGQGGALALAPLVLGNLYGSGYLGSLIGAYWLVATAGSLIGPPLAGGLRDSTGTYFPVMVVFAASMFCAALLAGAIRAEVAPVPRPLMPSARGAAGTA